MKHDCLACILLTFFSFAFLGGVTYPLKEFLFNNDIVFEHGLETVVDAFQRQVSGKVTTQNHSNFTLHVAKETIEHGRALRLQSLNAYRKRFRLAPYESFTELTGKPALHNCRLLPVKF